MDYFSSSGYANQMRSDFNFLPKADVLGNDLADLKNVYDQIIIVGMGGSSLGTKAISDFLGLSHVIFFDSIDPKNFEEKLSRIKKAKSTLIFFISKSGSTAETLALTKTIPRYFNNNHDCKFVVLTADPNSQLGTLAQDNEFEKALMNPLISGRYSVFSNSTLLPLNFAKHDLGNNIVSALLNEKTITDNDDYLHSFLKTTVTLDLQTINLWIYGDKLLSTASWFRQLWAESLGKYGNLPLLNVCRCPQDHHSFLQQAIESAPNQSNLFIFDSSDEASTDYRTSFNTILVNQRRACRDILDELSPACVDIDISNLTAHLKFLKDSMISVVKIADSMGLNPFDQPKIECYKERLNNYLGQSA